MENINSNKVLEENKYLDSLRHIIQRDFYPDLANLKSQLEWMNAVESNDLDKMRSIQLASIPMTNIRTDAKNAGIFTPLPQNRVYEPFETPNRDIGIRTELNIPITPIDSSLNLTLDQFLSNYSSEDDHSFKELQAKQFEDHKLKYSWLYDCNSKNKNSKLNQQQLTLTNGEDTRLLLTDGSKYTPKNQLMFIPSTNYNNNINNMNPKEIVYSNTRISDDIYKDMERFETNSTIKKNISIKPFEDMTLEEQVQYVKRMEFQGEGLLSTPSIIPGNTRINSIASIEQSPIMTWGKIDGTPLLLPGSTPMNIDRTLSNRPSFQIPNTPKREILAQKLSDKFNKSTNTNSTIIKSNKNISPSIQKHFERKLQQTPTTPSDQLRASYNSPLLKNKNNQTPTNGNRTIPKTPSNLSITPKRLIKPTNNSNNI